MEKPRSVDNVRQCCLRIALSEDHVTMPPEKKIFRDKGYVKTFYDFPEVIIRSLPVGFRNDQGTVGFDDPAQFHQSPVGIGPVFYRSHADHRVKDGVGKLKRPYIALLKRTVENSFLPAVGIGPADLHQGVINSCDMSIRVSRGQQERQVPPARARIEDPRFLPYCQFSGNIFIQFRDEVIYAPIIPKSLMQ